MSGTEMVVWNRRGNKHNVLVDFRSDIWVCTSPVIVMVIILLRIQHSV